MLYRYCKKLLEYGRLADCSGRHLRQSYHLLSLHGYAKNIAKKLPYPKIAKVASPTPAASRQAILRMHPHVS
jgi:hypothetical protein